MYSSVIFAQLLQCRVLSFFERRIFIKLSRWTGWTTNPYTFGTNESWKSWRALDPNENTKRNTVKIIRHEGTHKLKLPPPPVLFTLPTVLLV